MSPRPSTSSNQPTFTAWLLWGISKPSTSSTHLRWLYSSDRVASGKTQVGADLGLHYLGNPGPAHIVDSYIGAPSPCPCTADPPQGQRVVVSGHSQSLQLTGLGKYLQLTCQQKSRLNYKRRVYSAHTTGALRVPSLGDRGGYAIEPYRTPTTLDHTTKTQSQSSST